MAKLSFFISLFLLFSSSAFSQVPIQEELSRNYVKIAGGKMVFEKNGLLRPQDDTTGAKPLKIRFHCEAPSKGLMSRDFFVLSSTLAVMQFFPKQYAFEEKPNIGKNVDFDYVITMDEKGVNVARHMWGKKSGLRSHTTWEQVLDNF